MADIFGFACLRRKQAIRTGFLTCLQQPTIIVPKRIMGETHKHNPVHYVTVTLSQCHFLSIHQAIFLFLFFFFNLYHDNDTDLK